MSGTRKLHRPNNYNERRAVHEDILKEALNRNSTLAHKFGKLEKKVIHTNNGDYNMNFKQKAMMMLKKAYNTYIQGLMSHNQYKRVVSNTLDHVYKEQKQFKGGSQTRSKPRSRSPNKSRKYSGFRSGQLVPNARLAHIRKMLGLPAVAPKK